MITVKIIGIICLLTLVTIGVMQSTRLRVWRHVSGRQRLTEDKFAEMFFADNRPTAVRVLQLLAPYVPVSVDRLHPQDRLAEDLGLGALDGLDSVAFIQDLEGEFKIKLHEWDEGGSPTFQAVVDTIAEKQANTKSG